MEEIVKNNILDAIHYVLKFQHQKLSDEQIAKADSEIIPYAEENFDFNEKEFKVKHFGVPLLANDKRIYPIVIRYYAICQNNLDLLQKLQNVNFIFIGEHHYIKFYALDKQVTNKFKEKDFIRYIMKYSPAFEHFYGSLNGVEYHERERLLKDFAEIIKHDPTVLRVGNEDVINCNFLTRRNIELFGKEFLIKTTEKQRNLINSFYFNITENNIDKIKELIEKYPDYNMKSVPLYGDIFDDFTVDELGTMSSKDAKLYAIAIKNQLVKRMKELLSINPDFDCPKKFINKYIFWLTNEEILSLDWETMEEISKIKLVRLKDNKLVFPVKKMRAIIDKSNQKKKMNETKEKIDGIIEKISVFHRK